MASEIWIQPMNMNKSIDAWTKRLLGVGVFATWLVLAGLMYGLVQLVAIFF